MEGFGASSCTSRQTENHGYVADDPQHSVLFRLPSPICLGSVSPSPEVVRVLIREPNLRLYLLRTAKEAKNMYYRYHV
jgi:hypothetical protein